MTTTVRVMMTSEEYFESLPKKRVVATMVVRSHDAQVLLVRPTYRDGWLLPGGTVEANESPSAAMGREFEEELGVRAPVSKLVVVEHATPDPPATEVLHFVFRCAPMPLEFLDSVTLPPSELRDVGFFPLEHALELSPVFQRRRLAAGFHAAPQHTPVML